MNDRKAVKKAELPRRKKALRRTAAALALLVFMILTNLYGFLPIQALRNQEDRSGVRRTEILRRDYLPQVHPFSLFYLSCNKDVVMLTSMRWNLLGGWYPVYAPVLDCDGSEPVVSGTYSVTYSDSDQYILYVFGCVNDPDIASVERHRPFPRPKRNHRYLPDHGVSGGGGPPGLRPPLPPVV